MIDFSPFLEAVDIKINDSLAKAGYDKTIIGTIAEVLNPEAGLYLVASQYSYFNAYSYNGILYSEGDNVYVTLPNSDSNLDKCIIGKVAQNVQERIDVYLRELDKYGSLGDILLGADFLSDAKITPKNNEFYLEGSVSEEDTQDFKGGLLVSPTFVCELFIEPNIPDPNVVNDYGIEFEFEFAATEVDGSIEGELNDDKKRELGLLDGNGHDYTKYYRTYKFGIDKMSGQPLASLDGATMHQYAIFTVENAQNFRRISKIRLYGDFAEVLSNDDSDETTGSTGAAAAKTSINFVAVKFYAAENLNGYGAQYDVSLGSKGQTVYITVGDRIELNATFRINNADFVSSNLEYYWFVEDLRVKFNDKENYHRFGGDGWRCLNKKENIAIVDDSGEDITLFEVKDWIPDSSSLVVDKNNATLYENRFKCCIFYRNILTTSQIFTVINKSHVNDPYVTLSSKVRSYNSKEINNETEINRFVDSQMLQFTDTAIVECNLINNTVFSNLKYIWQRIDSSGNSEWWEPNLLADNKTYIYGSDICDHLTLKCGIIGTDSEGNDEYLGANYIILSIINQDMRLRLLSKENTFNSLTGGGDNVGIYYVYKESPEDEDFIKVDSEDIDAYDPKKLELYINATYIKSGHLEVSGKSRIPETNEDGSLKRDEEGQIVYKKDENGNDIYGDINTLFYVDVENPLNTQIGGFHVTDRAFYNEKQELDDISSGVYVGIDGIAIGNENKYIRADANGNLEISGDIYATNLTLGENAEIKGTIYATRGEIGGFIIDEDQLYNENKDNGDFIGLSGVKEYSIWAGNEEPEDANFWVKQNGDLYAQNVTVKGTIYANAGRIGGYNLKDNILEVGEEEFYVALDGNKTVMGNEENPHLYAMWMGNEDPIEAPFSVTKKGEIRAVSGAIGGFKITEHEINTNLKSIDYSKTDKGTYSVAVRTLVPKDRTVPVRTWSGEFDLDSLEINNRELYDYLTYEILSYKIVEVSIDGDEDAVPYDADVEWEGIVVGETEDGEEIIEWHPTQFIEYNPSREQIYIESPQEDFLSLGDEENHIILSQNGSIVLLDVYDVYTLGFWNTLNVTLELEVKVYGHISGKESSELGYISLNNDETEPFGLWIGAKDPEDSKFSVTKKGDIKAETGVIGNLELATETEELSVFIPNMEDTENFDTKIKIEDASFNYLGVYSNGWPVYAINFSFYVSSQQIKNTLKDIILKEAYKNNEENPLSILRGKTTNINFLLLYNNEDYIQFLNIESNEDKYKINCRLMRLSRSMPQKFSGTIILNVDLVLDGVSDKTIETIKSATEDKNFCLYTIKGKEKEEKEWSSITTLLFNKNSFIENETVDKLLVNELQIGRFLFKSNSIKSMEDEDQYISWSRQYDNSRSKTATISVLNNLIRITLNNSDTDNSYKYTLRIMYQLDNNDNWYYTTTDIDTSSISHSFSPCENLIIKDARILDENGVGVDEINLKSYHPIGLLEINNLILLGNQIGSKVAPINEVYANKFLSNYWGSYKIKNSTDSSSLFKTINMVIPSSDDDYTKKSLKNIFFSYEGKENELQLNYKVTQSNFYDTDGNHHGTFYFSIPIDTSNSESTTGIETINDNCIIKIPLPYSHNGSYFNYHNIIPTMQYGNGTIANVADSYQGILTELYDPGENKNCELYIYFPINDKIQSQMNLNTSNVPYVLIRSLDIAISYDNIYRSDLQ